MKELVYATGNDEKFGLALSVASKLSVELIQKNLDVDEIQSEDIEKIARDKTAKAYEIVKKPVITSDDSWSITALHGFPGPYMKSLNNWLNTDEMLSLFANLKNREIILTQMVVYQDKVGQHVFSRQSKAQLLRDARGRAPGSPNQEIIVMDGDAGKTIAEVFNNGELSNAAGSKIWQPFFEWYIQR